MGNRVLSCIYSPLANRQAPQLFQPICLVKTSRTITTAINITMLFSKTAVLARGLAILPLTLAYDCTNTNAFDWPKPSSGGSGSGGSCSETCGNDLSCVQQCLELEIMGGCAAICLRMGAWCVWISLLVIIMTILEIAETPYQAITRKSVGRQQQH